MGKLLDVKMALTIAVGIALADTVKNLVNRVGL